VVFLAPEKIDSQTDLRQWWRYVPGANWRHPGGPATDIVGRGSFPVVTVTYEDAQAYAKWKGRRLPTEAEWEWAARAGQTTAGLDHDQPSAANTWQGAFPIVNSGEDGFVGLAPSGCYPPNALGLYDMIGNVWEITTDIWNPSHQMLPTAAPDQMPADMRMGAATDGAGSRVIKGGSFLCAPNYCARYRSGSRQPQEEDLAASHLGFRTVLLAPPP
jgi:formylglycine-generating enzyme required for sulfatase activity